MSVQKTTPQESVGGRSGPTLPGLRWSGGYKPREIVMDETQDNGDFSGKFHSLTERRRSLFEPLRPKRSMRDGSSGSLLPPPDFDPCTYPRGWLTGKKRKLVNVDVVESMRHIAIHEMNRKDLEIHGLTEQLEEDARAMEHLQLQLQQERQKRLDVERENSLLQDEVNMLMNMLNEIEEANEIENIRDDELVIKS